MKGFSEAGAAGVNVIRVGQDAVEFISTKQGATTMLCQRVTGCCGVGLCVVLVLWCGLTVFVWYTKWAGSPAC